VTAKCTCNHCPTHLEFDAANAGQAIVCPSCGMETTLYIPPQATIPVEKTETPPATKPNAAVAAGILIFTVAAILRWLDWIGDETFFFLIVGSIISAFMRKLDKIERNTRNGKNEKTP